MTKRGRPRKAGPRNKSGRLITPIDKGTEHAQAMYALYGEDGCDAIGRAYRAGLLGEGSEAKALLDTARAIAGAYWVAYSTGRYQCALGDRTHGNVTQIDSKKAKAREEWLNGCLDVANRMGRDVRRAFDQLVIDINPDHGPSWIDELIHAKRAKYPAPLAAKAQLRRALDALDALV